MAYRPSAGRNQHPVSDPQIPDLVPLMNLFLTVIPFLLLMLVITQVALVAFNFSAAPPGKPATADGTEGLKKDVPEVTVIITASQDSLNTTFPGFEIREPGVISYPVLLKNGQYDYIKLDAGLKAIRERFPDLQDISVVPYNDVKYDTLIKTIDICRSNNFANVHYRAPQVRYYVMGDQ